MIGETVQHYRIESKLGEGGMGEVWKALDTRLDRHVALKFLPEKTGENPATVERFLREARAASALNHPGICTIHDIGDWQGRRYIVMEYVEGRTLGDLSRTGAMDIETVVEVGIQLADALDAAHAKNIIHRDIKSSNIILSPRGQAKILDFGLAKIVLTPERAQGGDVANDQTMEWKPDLTDAGQAVGTVSYMSPEQALGKEVDGRTDIFSLGVVLYEMATGRPAFSGSTNAAIFDAILNKAPTSPISLNRNLPPELERIFNKALEKDRDLRYQSAAELMTDLKRLRRDSSSQSVHTAVAIPRRAGRNRLFGIALVVLVAAAAAVVLFTRTRTTAPGLAGPLKTTPLTSLVGVEEGGTWSPDGSFFAFSHSAAGPADIYVMSSTGGDPIHLVASEADDDEPRWSPDNRWIAFGSSRGGTISIYLVPPLGGNIQKLVDLGVSGLSGTVGLGSAPWSPDGRYFVYSREDSTRRRAIWRMDIDTRQETKLTRPPEGEDDLYASWSFDGNRIAFTRETEETSHVLVMRADGSDVRETLPDGGAGVLPEGNGGLSYPAWSPDSRSLLVEEDFLRGNTSGIWLLHPESHTLTQVVQSSGAAVGAVAVARNGRVLYNTFSHQTDLYMRDLSTGEEKRLTAHTRDNFGARFSPDGKRVTYASSRSGNFEIWILDLETDSERRLTNNESMDTYPDWSPDGREIAFVSSRNEGEGSGAMRLWVVPVDGGAPRMLSEQPASGPVVWSPSGKEIGFVSWDGQVPSLWVVDRATGASRSLMQDVRTFDWYLDDRHVIITTHNPLGPGEMRVVDLESGESVLLLDEPQIELQVSHDGRTVSYCSATSHYNMNLHFLHLEPAAGGLPRVVGVPEQITHGDGEWHVHNGDWSAAGRFVIYTRDTDVADIFQIEGIFPAQP